MDKKVILISLGSVFFVKTIRSGLEEEDYEVKSIKPDISEIENIKENSDIVILFLWDDLYAKKDVLIFLKDICIEDDKTLFLIGNKQEFEVVVNLIPDVIVAKKFERPVNVDDIIEELDRRASEDKKKNILVVDDDGVFLRNMHNLLSIKYKVTMESSGMNAITYLAKHTPDLVLLDYEMPVTDGPQVLAMIRSEPATRDIPVMFLTGRDDKESVMKVMELHPDGYLLKSQKPGNLKRTIDNFFDAKKSGMK